MVFIIHRTNLENPDTAHSLLNPQRGRHSIIKSSHAAQSVIPPYQNLTRLLLIPGLKIDPNANSSLKNDSATPHITNKTITSQIRIAFSKILVKSVRPVRSSPVRRRLGNDPWRVHVHLYIGVRLLRQLEDASRVVVQLILQVLSNKGVCCKNAKLIIRNRTLDLPRMPLELNSNEHAGSPVGSLECRLKRGVNRQCQEASVLLCIIKRGSRRAGRWDNPAIAPPPKQFYLKDFDRFSKKHCFDNFAPVAPPPDVSPRPASVQFSKYTGRISSWLYLVTRWDPQAQRQVLPMICLCLLVYRGH